MSATTLLWESLERRRKTVFLVAGVLLLGYAVSKAIYTFTAVTAVGAFDVAFGGFGLLVGILSLFSLYPSLHDGAPKATLAGVVVTVIAAAGTLATLGWLAGATLTMRGYPAVPEEAPAWTVLALIVVFVTIALGFLLFGAASLRTDVFSGRVGGLLIVPGLGWIGLIAGNLSLPSGQYLGLVYFPISLALLAISYLLKSEAAGIDAVDPASESTA